MGNKRTDAQRRASAKWEASHVTKMTFKFSLENDADVLQKLAEVENMSAYIKSLIRRDLGAK